MSQRAFVRGHHFNGKKVFAGVARRKRSRQEQGESGGGGPLKTTQSWRVEAGEQEARTQPLGVGGWAGEQAVGGLTSEQHQRRNSSRSRAKKHGGRYN